MEDVNVRKVTDSSYDKYTPFHQSFMGQAQDALLIKQINLTTTSHRGHHLLQLHRPLKDTRGGEHPSLIFNVYI